MRPVEGPICLSEIQSLAVLIISSDAGQFTPREEAKPRVLRRWTREAFPKCCNRNRSSSDASRTWPTVLSPPATRAVRILSGKRTLSIRVSSGSSGIGSIICNSSSSSLNTGSRRRLRIRVQIDQQGVSATSKTIEPIFLFPQRRMKSNRRVIAPSGQFCFQIANSQNWNRLAHALASFANCPIDKYSPREA